MSETRSPAETIYPGLAQNTTEATDADIPAQTTTETPGQTGAEPTAPEEPGSTVLTGKPDEAPKDEAEPPPPAFDPEGITFPEGVTPDPEVFGKFGEIAKAAGMSQATAQSLMDLYSEVAGTQAQKNLDAWKTVREGWVAAVKANPEIGGDKLPGVVRKIAKLLDNPALAHPGLREHLEISALGDSEPLIWTFNRLADALGEGTFVSGDAPSRQSPRSLAQIMYPHLSER